MKLSTGGFESQESYAGGLSLGFTTPWAEFSGGAALNWNVDLSRYAWNDVNGDGILDQIHKIDGAGSRRCASAPAPGCSTPSPYGDMPRGRHRRMGHAGQQVAFDRTNGARRAVRLRGLHRPAVPRRLLPDHQPRRQLPEQRQHDRGRPAGRQRRRLRRLAADARRQPAHRRHQQAGRHQPAGHRRQPARRDDDDDLRPRRQHRRAPRHQGGR